MPVLLSIVAQESVTCLETPQHSIHHKSVLGHGKKREVLEQLLGTGR